MLMKAKKLPPLRLHLNEPWAYSDHPAELYPDPSFLKEEIVKLHQVNQDQVQLTSGADGAIDLVNRALDPGKVVILDPDFPRYEFHAANARHSVTKVRIGIPGFSFPTHQLLHAIDRDTSLVIVSTVANPTGIRLPRQVVGQIHHLFPQAIIMVDEVYSPFTGDDYASYASATAGVISVRSLSKVGWPGLRVGWIVGAAETLAKFKPFAPAYPVPGPCVGKALGAVKAHQAWIGTVQRQIDAREYLTRKLSASGIPVRPSAGNWVLAHFGSEAPLVVDSLKESVLLQLPMAPDLQGWIRISTPQVSAMIQLLKALTPFMRRERAA
jgi:histidinol-phosphate aminotransferase